VLPSSVLANTEQGQQHSSQNSSDNFFDFSTSDAERIQKHLDNIWMKEKLTALLLVIVVQFNWFGCYVNC